MLGGRLAGQGSGHRLSLSVRGRRCWKVTGQPLPLPHALDCCAGCPHRVTSRREGGRLGFCRWCLRPLDRVRVQRPPHLDADTHLSGGKTEVQRTPAPSLETAFGPYILAVRLHRRSRLDVGPAPGLACGPGRQNHGHTDTDSGTTAGLEQGFRAHGDSLTCSPTWCPAWPTEVVVSAGPGVGWLWGAELGLGHPGLS